jgi:hypothetical protein
LDPFTLDFLARDLIRFNEVNTDEFITPTGTFMGWGAAKVCVFTQLWFILIYVHYSTFDKSDNVFIVLKLGAGLSPRLRYADVAMLENSPTCGFYSSDEFTFSTMICAASLPSK